MPCHQGDPAAAAARGRLLFPGVVYEMVATLNPAFTHAAAKGRMKHLVALARHGPSAAVLHPLCRRRGVWPTGCHLAEPSEWW